MGIVCAIMGLIMAYLIGQVAYREGRKSKWEEMCREYICLHKSVIICHEKKEEKANKRLDNKRKKKYNKESYRKSK